MCVSFKMIESGSKPCNTCGVTKPLSEYHKNKSSKGGHLPRCKSCRKVADADYIESHRYQTRLRAGEWRENNKDHADNRARVWALKNPDRSRAIKTRWRNSEAGIQYGILYVQKRDTEKRKATALRYYLANTDRYRNYVRNRRAKVRGAIGSHTKEDVAEIARKQIMRCACCHEKLLDDYHADHVMPLALGGSNDKLNLQALCPTCNKKKGAMHPIDFANRNGLLL